ncbi:hypothetical protein [Pontixanthobacter aquaemixtae]|uniref:Outer membrane lipoprotein-sorting protein n=1 Tax=Pontixanthobacter aquaemixtae TaxID=1958940 RepID=A0A844ZTE9_9SPHN|nr:hypothetical protein [Pontixanthobacter aquaemixtae]MXO90582.1 hypothetical protein [Pontixanthobacter aquaemixtae]
MAVLRNPVLWLCTLVCAVAASVTPAAAQQRPIDKDPVLASEKEVADFERRAKEGITVSELLDIMELAGARYSAEYRKRVASRIVDDHKHLIGEKGNRLWFYSGRNSNKILRRVRKSGTVSFLVTPDAMVQMNEIGLKRSVAMTFYAPTAKPANFSTSRYAFNVSLPDKNSPFADEEVRVTDANISVVSKAFAVSKFYFTISGNRFCEFIEYRTAYFDSNVDREQKWMTRLGQIFAKLFRETDSSAPIVCYYDAYSAKQKKTFQYTESLDHRQIPYWPSTDPVVSSTRVSEREFLAELRREMN